MAEQGAIPRRELLESEARLAASNALMQAESRLEVLEARTEVERSQAVVQVAQSRAQLSAGTDSTRLQQLGASPNPDGTITIKASISGTIADREVTLGQSAEDAGEILVLLNLGMIFFESGAQRRFQKKSYMKSATPKSA